MNIAALYLPFENGEETLIHASCVYWQGHLLSACDINGLSFFPKFNTKSNSKKNNLADYKLLSRITIFGFLKYEINTLSDKTNIFLVLFYYDLVIYLLFFLKRVTVQILRI